MTHGTTQVLEPIARDASRTPVAIRLPDTSSREHAPDVLQCLRCQLLGGRRLTCTRADLCRELPRFHPLGAILVAAWVATAVGFVAAVW